MTKTPPFVDSLRRRWGVPSVLTWLVAALAGAHAQVTSTNGARNIGQRLFFETRFAEFFYTNSYGDANAILTNGDPVMNVTASLYGPLPGPFAGESMNCRACHLVAEHEATGNRIYCDFATRSPIPNIGDGRTTTTRNALPLVDALAPRPTPLFLHNDGQFTTAPDLIVATLTGRNFGWAPTEYATALHHIAQIIRNDDGTSELATSYGGLSYAEVFQGGSGMPAAYLIPPQNRMDVTITNTNDPAFVTDQQIVQNIASLIGAYLQTLVFSQDTNGLFNGSPYDVFLIKNGLPRQPGSNEPPLQYGRHLLRLVAALPNPQFVTDPADGHFQTDAHGQLFQFGANELAGLEIFLTDNTSLDIAANLEQEGVTSGIEVGNCIACHAPPYFTDFLFHNTGATQEEYDTIFGPGAFVSLPIPTYAQRATNYDAYLPPTTNHPNATGIFDLPPASGSPGQVDLGLWNVFANPDFPAPQSALQQVLPQLLSAPSPCITQVLLNAGAVYLAGTNGPPGWPYYVLTSPNLTAPFSNWTILSSNTFDSQGDFSVTNALPANQSQSFFAISLGPIPPDAALAGTIGLFKTPTVRDLVSSEPYLHTGQMDTIEDVIDFYASFAGFAREGFVRNAAPQLSAITLDDSSVPPLAAFLRALDEEDYTDALCPCQ